MKLSLHDHFNTKLTGFEAFTSGYFRQIVGSASETVSRTVNRPEILMEAIADRRGPTAIVDLSSNSYVLNHSIFLFSVPF